MASHLEARTGTSQAGHQGCAGRGTGCLESAGAPSVGPDLPEAEARAQQGPRPLRSLGCGQMRGT
eukprot:3699923-Alexandrium_andersonii.AAC.1